MKLSNLRENYEFHSGKASELTRQLSLAGLGVIWIFKIGTDASPQINPQLFNVAAIFVAALMLDYFQYVFCTVIWGAYHRIKERRTTEASRGEEFLAPRQINWPALTFFWLKIGATIWGHTLLLAYLYNRWAIEATITAVKPAS